MYLTLLIISNPLVASNNRGENEGNMQTLQKLKTREGMRTILSGYAIKRAIRDSMQAGGAAMWRKVLDNPKDNPAGYGYGPKDAAAMVDAVPKLPTDYDDTICFGYMIAKKGESEDAAKQRGNVEVSNAVSTTPYDGDTTFTQGLKAKDGQLAPFASEKHYTRYQYTLTANLRTLAAREKALGFCLRALLSLRVGGSHASNASEVTPAVLVWRFHDAPGRGGLYLGAGVDFLPDAPVDLAPLGVHCTNLGVTDYTVAGIGMKLSVAEGVEAIIREAEARMAKVRR